MIVHDPKAISNAKKRFPNLKFAQTARECITGSDLVLHLTEWREYRDLKPEEVVDLVKTPRIIDGRNVLDRDRWVKAGWKFHALGRSES